MSLLDIYSVPINRFPANTSTLNQHWNNVDPQRSSTWFGWKWELSRRTFIDVVSTLAKQHGNNIHRITSIQRRWTKVVSTLQVGWKWKLIRRILIDVVSTLTKQRRNNIKRITFIQCRWANAVSTLMFGWK